MTITTREGREELRREHRLVNMYIPSEVKANLGLALDGLDIAQEKLYAALTALRDAVAISTGPRSEREAAIQTAWENANEALTKWDEWCS